MSFVTLYPITEHLHRALPTAGKWRALGMMIHCPRSPFLSLLHVMNAHPICSVLGSQKVHLFNHFTERCGGHCAGHLALSGNEGIISPDPGNALGIKCCWQ